MYYRVITDNEKGINAVRNFDVDDDLLQTALDKWGENFNLDMAIEEMAELIVEIQHLRRGRPHEAYSELADVRLVIRTMELMLGDEELYQSELEAKQERLRTRIGQ